MPSFTLPFPKVTVNHLYNHSGLVHLSEQGRRWRDEAIIAMRQQRRDWEVLQTIAKEGDLKMPRSGEDKLRAFLSVAVMVYIPDARRRDVDNFLKLTLDTSLGEAGIDDTNVREVYIRKELDRANPRIELTILYYVPTLFTGTWNPVTAV